MVDEDTLSAEVIITQPLTVTDRGKLKQTHIETSKILQGLHQVNRKGKTEK